MAPPNLKMMRPKKAREDVKTTESSQTGVKGVAEKFLRRFRTLSFGLLLSPLALVCCFCLGVASAPGIFVFHTIDAYTASWPLIFHYAACGFGLALGFLTYGISLIFVVPEVNFIIPLLV